MKQTPGKAAVNTMNVGDRLAYPRDKLCISCHEDLSPATASNNGLSMHGPVAKGWCSECHNPHKSPLQYLLLKSNIELCSQCHLKADLQITLAHQQNPETDCVDCHNPHMGSSAMLLKDDYDEWQRYQ